MRRRYDGGHRGRRVWHYLEEQALPPAREAAFDDAHGGRDLLPARVTYAVSGLGDAVPDDDAFSGASRGAALDAPGGTVSAAGPDVESWRTATGLASVS
jgi:hypothetical protein